MNQYYKNMNSQQSTYYSDNYLNNCIRARKFELDGKWHEARQLRKALGQKSDVEAIDMIIDATNKGDEFRRLIAGVYERWEKREINNSELNQILTEAHNKVYKNK